MPARIAPACRDRGEPVPADHAGLARRILDSLAPAHRTAVDDACALSGRTAPVVHLVGGGARNTLLRDLAADACDRPVVAGLTGSDPCALRALVRGTRPVRTHRPRPDPARSRAADRARERLAGR